MWRRYATLFGSDGGSFDGSGGFWATTLSSLNVRPLSLWMRSVYPACDYSGSISGTVFAESRGSEQRHYRINRGRDQRDAFADSGTDGLGLYRARVVPRRRRSVDDVGGAPVSRGGWTRRASRARRHA